jgi:hypothetical protein
VTELLSGRDLTAIDEEFERAAAPPLGPVEWAQQHGLHLWSMQRDIANSVRDNKRTAAATGAGIGKSYIAAVLVCWWIDTHPVGDAYVWTTAPLADQVHGILWEEVRKLHQRLRLRGEVQQTDRWVIAGMLAGQGRKPADKAAGSDEDPDTGQGFHRRYLLVILDEAGGLDEWLWNAAENITTGDDCRILAIGNPDHASSRLAEVCGGHELWTPFIVSVLGSPNFTGEPVPAEVRRMLTSRQWEEDRRKDWGVTDRRYISKVLARFPSDHPDQVVPAGDLAACGFAEARSPTELVPVELGVDVGGGGDWTIIRERRGIRAGRRWAKKTDNPEMAAPLVQAAILQTGATSVKVDGIGIGWGLAGELRNAKDRGEHGAQIHVVMVSEKAHEPEKYANLRSELWWVIARVGSQRREWDLSEMDGAEVTCAQLLMPRWRPDAKGRIQVEPKADIRARTSGKSPDDADALNLAYYVPRNAQSSYFEALTSGRLRG